MDRALRPVDYIQCRFQPEPRFAFDPDELHIFSPFECSKNE